MKIAQDRVVIKVEIKMRAGESVKDRCLSPHERQKPKGSEGGRIEDNALMYSQQGQRVRQSVERDERGGLNS